ncbi:hypothetical protein [Noviherbaspirillum sp.]
MNRADAPAPSPSPAAVSDPAGVVTTPAGLIFQIVLLEVTTS